MLTLTFRVISVTRLEIVFTFVYRPKRPGNYFKGIMGRGWGRGNYLGDASKTTNYMLFVYSKDSDILAANFYKMIFTK